MAVFCLACSLALSQESPEKKESTPKKPKFEIIQHGTFATGGATVKRSGLPPVFVTENSQLISTTDTVELKLNHSFGIKYLATDTAGDGQLTVVHTISHPPMVNPKTKESSVQFRRSGQLQPTNMNVFLWTFGEPFEMVPGSYVFRVYHKGEKVLEKAFLVTLPLEGESKKAKP